MGSWFDCRVVCFGYCLCVCCFVVTYCFDVGVDRFVDFVVGFDFGVCGLHLGCLLILFGFTLLLMLVGLFFGLIFSLFAL